MKLPDSGEVSKMGKIIDGRQGSPTYYTSSVICLNGYTAWRATAEVHRRFSRRIVLIFLKLNLARCVTGICQ
jgi:hypothetical protein